MYPPSVGGRTVSVNFLLWNGFILSDKKQERIILSAADTGFVDRIRKELEAQNCEVRLAVREAELLKAIREFSPTLLILGAEGFRNDPSPLVRFIRGNKDLEKLPILACTDDAGIVELEKKFGEDRTVVVTNSFITTYISDMAGLKTLFDS